MQDIHDFALQRGASVKFWDKARTSLVIAREPDAPQQTQSENTRGASQESNSGSDEGYGE